MELGGLLLESPQMTPPMEDKIVILFELDGVFGGLDGLYRLPDEVEFESDVLLDGVVKLNWNDVNFQLFKKIIPLTWRGKRILDSMEAK